MRIACASRGRPSLSLGLLLGSHSGGAFAKIDSTSWLDINPTVAVHLDRQSAWVKDEGLVVSAGRSERVRPRHYSPRSGFNPGGFKIRRPGTG